MRKFSFLAIVAFLFASVVATSCHKDDTSEQLDQYLKQLEEMRDNEMKLLDEYVKKENITVDPSETGLYKVLLQEGTGDIPTAGKVVSVHYIGSLLNGTEFDNSYKRNNPIVFELGRKSMIPGFEEGVATMKKGEKSRLIFPSSLGYGIYGKGNIPPFASLIFDVELVDFK